MQRIQQEIVQLLTTIRDSWVYVCWKARWVVVIMTSLATSVLVVDHQYGLAIFLGLTAIIEWILILLVASGRMPQPAIVTAWDAEWR
ncbi:MAG: hypothetical protein A2854_01115 [Parcubacteria group bacterium RIFCSPHIGHO2_01_FULL_56_18]|nr:MAG: hypothetical protein A2854_01115 [Parcubacteria group bacterium RIFCSPHIGHO2_01_FULL_56_18]